MSYIGSQVKMMFGGANPGDALARASAGANHQLIPEFFTAGSMGRAITGPQDGSGMYSFHALVVAGASPVGTLTVWYSNLPNPDPNIDAHWVQDATITAIDLSVVANTFKSLSFILADHIRFKTNVVSGTAGLILWAKSGGS